MDFSICIKYRRRLDRFKAIITEQSIDFLDTAMFKDPENENRQLTKVFFNPADTYPLLQTDY